MIIAFTSPDSTGGTFMNWSFHWLSGEKKFWNQKEGWIELLDNPLTDIHAHLHKKNTTFDIQSADNFITNAIKIKKNEEIITFYPHLGIDIRHIKNTSFNFFEDYYMDFENLIKFLNSRAVKIVLIKKDNPYPYFRERHADTSDQVIEEAIKTLWFTKQIKIKSSKKIREIASVMITKREKMDKEHNDNLSKNLQSIDSLIEVSDKEWYNNQLDTMKKVFNFLKLQIDKNRIEHWKIICEKWHFLLKKNLIDFYEKDVYLICEAIIKNKKINLINYNINLLKEILIMSVLFKSYKKKLVLPLDNFPLDTQELHKFLK